MHAPLSNDEIMQYKNNGFLIAKSFFSIEIIEVIREISCQTIKEKAENHWENYAAIFQQVHLPRMYSIELASFSKNKKLANAAKQLMSCNTLRIFLDQIICKRPMSKETVPHQDAPFLSFNDARSLNCWIPLTNVTLDMGAMSYYYGTHILGNLGLVHLDREKGLDESYPFLKKCKKIELEASAGDCLFHNCLTVHSARANTSKKDRLAYAIQYMPELTLFNGWEHNFMKPLGLKKGDILNNEQIFPTV